MSDSPPTPSSFWRRMFLNASPKYWALGIALLVLRVFALLPLSVLVVLGHGLGLLLRLLGGRLRAIAEANIKLCFPQKSEDERRQLVRASFAELGISILETAKVWFVADFNFYQRHVVVEGEEHLQAAYQRDCGILLLSCHSGSLDLNAGLVSFLIRQQRPYAFTYRKPSDPVVNHFLVSVRGRFSDYFYPVDNLVGLTRLLKKKGVVWYAPDIEVSGKNSVYAPFFGEPASTTVAISRLSKATGALVLPFAHYRQGKKYIFRFYPPLTDFADHSCETNTATINQQIEQMISPCPQRYWWVIKRFKRRPQGHPQVY